MIKAIAFTLVLIAAFAFFGYSARRIFLLIKIGKPNNRFDNVKTRIKNVTVIAFGQSKLFRDPIAGIVHALIFWGFLLFLAAVLESFIQGFAPEFSFEFLGPLYSMMTITQDLFGVLVIISVLMALYRRFIQKVKRLQVDREGNIDAAFILVMILFVVLSMMGQNAAHVAKADFQLSQPWEIRPLTQYLAHIFSSPDSATVPFEVFWWMHVVFVLGFLNYLPYSKHLHVITSVPNVYFAEELNKRAQLKPIDLNDENLEYFGVNDIEKFTWKQLLDGFSCTECGRCDSVCPALTVGKPLSPRKIITNIRDRTLEKGPLILKGETEDVVIDNTLVPNYTSEAALWSCTTCMACVQECPVMIEHVGSIVDMRRHLVLMESNFPPELATTFKNLENNASPWAFPASERAAWADGMGIKTMAEDSNTEYLFWVGCAGSFDERYKKVSRAFAGIMQEAGVDFRILGTEEQCNGDTARRLGNEYLAQTLLQSNVETMNNYGVKKIVTACPHCFNSLKNEFPQFGGNYEVKHHSEFIDELIAAGKIKTGENVNEAKITYHDPCYLGRYNDIYDEPRNLVEQATGAPAVEMERNRSKSFCCGAGGGRMFMEDTEGGRINIERSKEALETGADTIATACPFCMTMMTDGVKTLEKADEVKVKDIAEIVYENLKHK
ncbi:MAG: 4Fe-4S dicluster domain-containing protein [Ignavibacteriales bacterium]|nr:MAG: 4Fe-4S dicluster domain-containing protein [Ignavibacteriaceae bacterium]MBW7872284.1 4Fe-4S dicluster domain-containing protein [Ignavibacteria bacterium]MCZ2142566.1 4Fe-4S dicluster domain-containing protein [Ignavibacteriales bacterium]MBV6445569.1 putative iron-sulfur-binding oxidoreductase FadF [Ignavibacteriaceae bacterium]MBZ0196510.1 4Fe-4S dicluster domain-containing protein [Ignavibacteriaceae bacterium]